MSGAHLSRLQALEKTLGAWICREVDFSESDTEFESKARTFLCFLENVFGRFYEFKTRICDYEPIPKSYARGWDMFCLEAYLCAREGQPFNGICAVMHMQAYLDGDSYVIKDIGVRPCAIGWHFLEILVSNIAQRLPENRKLVFKVFGIRVEFITSLIEALRVQNPDLPAPTRTKEDKRNVMGKVTSEKTIEVITFDDEHLRALCNLEFSVALPTAEQLNDRKHARPGRIELIRRMIGNARGAFETFLLNAKNTTSYLPDGLALDENDLRVYRDGSWVTF